MKADFPVLPSYRARWQPIYLEPIPGSGEKLTAIIAIKGSDGAVYTHRVISTNTLSCTLGSDVARKLSSLVSACARSIDDHLKQNITLDNWLPPLSGFTSGQARESVGHDIHNIFYQASKLSSIFLFQNDSESNNKKHDEGTKIWLSNIQREVARINRDLSKLFNQKVPTIGGKIESKIGFFCTPYAANFGAISTDSKSRTSTFSAIQAKLWQLDQLRDALTIDRPEKLELIVKIPFHLMNERCTPDEVNDICEEIQLEANRRDIAVFKTPTPNEAATHLVKSAVA